MGNGLFGFLSFIRTADVIDILVVSFLLFIFLRILQKNVHRRVLLVLFTLAMVFWGARTYHWQLTLQFIEAAAIAVGVGFFLVFQEDLRRFFESYLFAAFSWEKEEKRSQVWTRAVLRSLQTFSKNQVGALIVIQQRIPLSNLIRGGHRLNGEVSFPLLCSIFDPHSAGHDGAVILKGSHVTRFGAHLPLSRKASRLGRTGTRHAAALGLSEVSDAIIFIVSEETGEISLAAQGELEQISPADLEKKLFDLHLGEERLPHVRRILSHIRHNWALECLCVIVSFLLWVSFIAPHDVQQRSLVMPLSLENIPADVLTDEPLPAEVRVTLWGSEDSFARWPRERQLIRLPLGQVKPGDHRLTLSERNLSLPPGIFLREFEPAIVAIQAHPTRLVTAPIVVAHNGRLPSSIQHGRVRTEPATVQLLVREGDPGPSMVMTEPLNFSKLKKGDRVDLKLIAPTRAQFNAQTPPTVRVFIE